MNKKIINANLTSKETVFFNFYFYLLIPFIIHENKIVQGFAVPWVLLIYLFKNNKNK